jgi:hypothetical protein
MKSSVFSFLTAKSDNDLPELLKRYLAIIIVVGLCHELLSGFNVQLRKRSPDALFGYLPASAIADTDGGEEREGLGAKFAEGCTSVKRDPRNTQMRLILYAKETY